MDEIELNDLDNHEEEKEEGTDFGGGYDEDNLLDSLDWLSNKGKLSIFGDKKLITKVVSIQLYTFTRTRMFHG